MGRRILIVDDSAVIRMILRGCLPPEADYEVREAKDGLAAVEAFREDRPDIVFLDLTMPVMDGVEALREIMAVDPEALVVVVTADIQPRSVERVMALGAFTVLRKPPVHEKVREVLESAEAWLEGRP